MAAALSALPPAVADRLARLTPDQRAAATAPPGPVLCMAPAGSGKTTTLVARIAWLVGSGTDPATIAAITFNRRAAVELAERLDAALAPLGHDPGAVRVKTFHALGLEILRSAGIPVEPLVDRDAVLRAAVPDAAAAERARLDLLISRLKIEHRVDPEAVAADPAAGRVGAAFVAYERAVRATGGLDFDDLVLRAVAALEDDSARLARWRAACTELLVDEVQDVDRGQLDLALLLAAPANRIFLVGDDDQTIYGWRLADVRRVLSLDDRLAGLRHVALVTNFRCPGPVVRRAVRLVEHNRERFPKTIRARPDAPGRLRLRADSRDDPVRFEAAIADLEDAGTSAVLARTNGELLPAVVACLALGRPFRAARLPELATDPAIDALIDRAERETDARWPLLVRLGWLRHGAAMADRGGSAGPEPEAPAPDPLTALIAWAAPYRDLDALRAEIAEQRRRLAELHRDDASLTLATAHGTKGLEWDDVLVVGMEADRFPSARSVSTAPEPDRALEEERRLAYVAWTRARVRLTLLYDPETPSRFLLEAFSEAELGLAGEGPTLGR